MLVAAAAGAAGVLAAAGRTWAVGDVAVPGPSAPVSVELAGSAIAPIASATGLAGLAALAAVAATRRWARRAVGALIALFGGIALYDVWRGTRPAELVRLVGEQSAVDGRTGVPDLTATWPTLGAAGAAVLLVAGVVTVARGGVWPGMGSRYDRHSAPTAIRAGDPAELWRSLDSGADPTVDSASEEDVPATGGDGPTGAPPTDDRA